MILFFSFVFLGFFLLAIQTALFPLFPHWLGRPDLIFILLVFVAYKFPWLSGLCLAFSLGWMVDVVSGMFLGTYPFMAILVFCIVKFFTQGSPVKETAYQVPLVGLSFFILQCVLYLFFFVTQPGVLPPWTWGRVVHETFILLVASIPCFAVFNQIYEKLRARSLSSKIMTRRGGNHFR